MMWSFTERRITGCSHAAGDIRPHPLRGQPRGRPDDIDAFLWLVLRSAERELIFMLDELT
jgi:hypothetical protein